MCVSNFFFFLSQVLNHVPFELNNLIENELGHAVKGIKKTAITLNNEKIVNETTHLIKIWKEMQSKQTSGKRDSPERCMGGINIFMIVAV